MKLPILLLCALIATSAVANDLDRAGSLVEDNRLDEARSVLLNAVKDPALKGESLVLLTRVCNLQQDWEAAVGYGEQAVKLLPASSEAHYVHAVALRLKMSSISRVRALFLVSDYKKALARALELDPKNLDAREEEIGFLLNAPGVAGGDEKKAEAKIGELKALDRPRGLYNEAFYLRHQGKQAEAVRVLTEILTERPDDHHLRFFLATTLQEQQRWADAERELVALEQVSDSAWAWAATYQRARSRVLGRYELEKAVELLQSFIARAPASGEALPPRAAAYWRLGNAYEQLGQRDRARQAYQQALALDPKHEGAAKSLKALK